MALKVTSPAFADGDEIPRKYTCEGEDVSPPLTFSGVPDGTASLVLIVDDPDAPDPKAPKMTYVHWVLFDLPPDTTEIIEGMVALPIGTKSGLNDWKRTGYGGPCPPIGRHRYFFKLYALDARLEGLSAATKADVVAAMQGHVLAEAQIVGTYQKAG
jgi:Raf kinase inhibitor-like YbhB/YbcL family protein